MFRLTACKNNGWPQLSGTQEKKRDLTGEKYIIYIFSLWELSVLTLTEDLAGIFHVNIMFN